MVPDALIQGQTLLAVVVAHVFASNTFYGTLVFAHTSALISHANLLVKACQVIALASHTLEINHASLVDEEAVGYASHIVTGLHILVGIGNNPFATFLEILQGMTYLLCCGRSIECGGATLNIDAFDMVVVLSRLNGFKDVVQSKILHVGSTK